ncbi:hypothetical protein Y032_1138g3675 [Ancylostoma ceylanicum]|uniref:Uncharacterized protein n=1 Tax=Ancylostoma ceylanicum TaxID=53326 RepID=A0A016W5P0_9BILA|nr:hypothetical protein Y032_1138g3675 [Ancylostoma ceylanicum]
MTWKAKQVPQKIVRLFQVTFSGSRSSVRVKSEPLLMLDSSRCGEPASKTKVIVTDAETCQPWKNKSAYEDYGGMVMFAEWTSLDYPQCSVKGTIHAVESATGDTRKTWIKQVETFLETLLCSIVEAKIITANCEEWNGNSLRQIIRQWHLRQRASGEVGLLLQTPAEG